MVNQITDREGIELSASFWGEMRATGGRIDVVKECSHFWTSYSAQKLGRKRSFRADKRYVESNVFLNRSLQEVSGTLKMDFLATAVGDRIRKETKKVRKK